MFWRWRANQWTRGCNLRVILCKSTVPLVPNDTFVRLARSRDWLVESLHQQVRLEDAARRACLSPFHFQRTFAQAFEETPHEFLTRMRLDRARKLLASDSSPVTEVCLDVGYASLGSFSALFHTRLGCSPSDYRRSLRQVYPAPFVPPHRFVPACFLQFYGATPL